MAFNFRLLALAALVLNLSGCGGGVGTSEARSSNGEAADGVGTGTAVATLQWVAPATNEDGTAAHLSGFNIYVGTAPNNLQPIASVNGNATAYTFTGLPSGTLYFAITAISDSGTESGYSNVAVAALN